MKKYVIPESIEWRLTVKNPVGRRKTFGVIRWRWEDGRKLSETVKNETLDSINGTFSSGALTLAEARKQVDLWVEGEYRKAGATIYKEVSNSENQKLLEAFFSGKYRNRKTKYKDAAYAGYRRVMDALKDVSLGSAGENEIQDAIDNHARKQARGDSSKYSKLQRRLIRDAKIMLTWFGRQTEVQLYKEPEVDEVVKALTADEVLVLVRHIEQEPVRIACLMAFYTGCRMGELMALNDLSLNRKLRRLDIRWSIDRAARRGPTKTRKSRNAYVYPEGMELFKEWLEIKEDVWPYRIRISKIVRSACMKAFPGDDSRNIKFHDLRHGYARRMASEGAPMGDIAASIGDTLDVCMKHYVGYAMDDDRMLRLHARLTEGQNILKEEGEDL